MASFSIFYEKKKFLLNIFKNIFKKDSNLELSSVKTTFLEYFRAIVPIRGLFEVSRFPPQPKIT